MDIIYINFENHLMMIVVNRIVFVGFVVSLMPSGVVFVDGLSTMGGVLSTDYHKE